MAKLYFHYSTMNAGKSTLLLQASHNYHERGMHTYLMTASIDDRAGKGRIASRIGISEEAEVFSKKTDLFTHLQIVLATEKIACVFVDEAQFLTCYGLRVDFRGQLFPGSSALLALSDEMREARTICHCGRKATMVIRCDSDGNALLDGEQVQIGGNETYVSLCRRHWREAVEGKSE
jgi:thymidine kinase